jgi:2-polyprenyl-3-methyl-5-hydroxy-6-metoxy-1,4-benzoquinol methylase
MRTEIDQTRDRIYARYATARDKTLVPASIDGLRPRLPYLRALIRHHFPKDPSTRILDLGCGHGAFLYALQEAGYTSATGVDHSDEQVQAAQRLGIDGVRQGDVFGTLAETATGSLDVAVTFDVIEHFTKHELIRMVDEISRVLSLPGTWIIHTPNAEGPFGARIRYGDFSHDLAFTRESITQVLKSGGFHDVACYEDQPVPHGPISFVRYLLWKVIRGALLLYVAIETGVFDQAAVYSQNLLVVARKT